MTATAVFWVGAFSATAIAFLAVHLWNLLTHAIRRRDHRWLYVCLAGSCLVCVGVLGVTVALHLWWLSLVGLVICLPHVAVYSWLKWAEVISSRTESCGEGAASRYGRCIDEDVQFTVYRPRVVRPDEWYTMLAFAHLSERPGGAKNDEPDPVEQVKKEAEAVLGQPLSRYQSVMEDSRRGVPREASLTFVPMVPGVEFNPPQRTFAWEEAVHRERFRLRASPAMDGQTARGHMSVFLGSILLADLSLSIRVDSKAKPQIEDQESISIRRYRKIFTSYSHKDVAVVSQCKSLAEALGDRFLQDCVDLRAGEDWAERVKELIDSADVFQLFWSSNSMVSPFVQQEWEYALSLNRPGFVRPTFWEEPLPASLEKDLPPERLRRLHFQRISLASSPSPVAGNARETAVPGIVTSKGTSSSRVQGYWRSFSVGRPREGQRLSSRGPASVRGVEAPAKVFISYRRDGGAEIARLIRDDLQRRGHRVFMDVEDLRSGPFNTALLAEIESATDVVVVLTPGCLDRCSDPRDWLRREVAHAIQCGKNVVPVVTRGFDWPPSLPEDLVALRKFQRVPPCLNYFEAGMDKVAQVLVSRPRRGRRPPVPQVAVTAGMAVLLLALAFGIMLPSMWKNTGIVNQPLVTDRKVAMTVDSNIPDTRFRYRLWSSDTGPEEGWENLGAGKETTVMLYKEGRYEISAQPDGYTEKRLVVMAPLKRYTFTFTNADRLRSAGAPVAIPTTGVETSATPEASIGKKWAVVIGVSDHVERGKWGLTNLRYASKDATLLASYLRSPRGGRFDQVELLTDANATVRNIRIALGEHLCGVQPDDLVLIFWSGHGLPDPHDPTRLYLLGHDTDPEHMVATAYAMDEFQRDIRSLHARRVIVIADACHSTGLSDPTAGDRGTIGNQIGGRFKDIAVEPTLPDDRFGSLEVHAFRLIFTSCEVGEISLESSELGDGHGVFTYYLLESLVGAADEVANGGNGDGKVCLGEMIDYTTDRVKRFSENRQHPDIGGRFDRSMPIGN
jgi:uncharacterized caspase-like protein